MSETTNTPVDEIEGGTEQTTPSHIKQIYLSETEVYDISAKYDFEENEISDTYLKRSGGIMTGPITATKIVLKNDTNGGTISDDADLSLLGFKEADTLSIGDAALKLALFGSDLDSVFPTLNGNKIITSKHLANVEEGLVKSGGDVTIQDGIIYVNDDSHDHVISNIDGWADIRESILEDCADYTDGKIADLVDEAPEALNTLKEIVDILGKEEELGTTLVTQIGTKVAKAGDTMSGQLKIDCSNPYIGFKETGKETYWYVQVNNEDLYMGTSVSDGKPVKITKDGDVTIPSSISALDGNFLVNNSIGNDNKLKFKLKTGTGAIYAGIASGNATMLRMDQTDGTPRFVLHTSASNGAVVIELPEKGENNSPSALYFDLRKGDDSGYYRVAMPQEAGTLTLTSGTLTSKSVLVGNSGKSLTTSKLSVDGHVAIIDSSKASVTTDTSFQVKNDKGEVWLLASVNRGIYDKTSEKWIIYVNEGDNATYVPNWANIGSTSQPIFFNASGKPEAVTCITVPYGGTGCRTFTSGEALIGNGTNAVTTRAILNNISIGPSGWVSTTESTQLINHNTLVHWNGASTGTSSNLKYRWGNSIIVGAPNDESSDTKYNSINSIPRWSGSWQLVDSPISCYANESENTVLINGSVCIKANQSNYRDGLRIQPASDNGWAIVQFGNTKDTHQGTEPGSWLVGRRGENAKALSGLTSTSPAKVGDFSIEENASHGINFIIHKNTWDGSTLKAHGGATLYGSFNVIEGNLNVSQTNGAGTGLALYGGTSPQNYGIWFGRTQTFGTHGSVTEDWATYFGMNSGATTRGWIFRTNDTNGCVASISGAGNLALNGTMTLAGKATMQYNSSNECLDFIFS